MGKLDIFMCFWALPSLITFLVVAQTCRMEGDSLERVSERGDMFILAIVSVVYPVGFLFVICRLISELDLTFLLKPITFKRKK